MSRTTLCVMTAAALAVLSLGVMAARHHVLGDEVRWPTGPGAWKVTMTVHGQATHADSRVVTSAPLDCQQQHVLRENHRSAQMTENLPEQTRDPRHRRVYWTPRPGTPPGPFKLRCEYSCAVAVSSPTAGMKDLTAKLHAPPAGGAYLELTGEGMTDERLAALARSLTAGSRGESDQAHALFRHVDKEIDNEPTVGLEPVSALHCLRDGSGDSGGKARLLVALLRHRGIPARVVTGLTLSKGPEQVAHYWAEAWLNDHWVPMCPFYHHYGKLPATYLTLAVGDVVPVRGRNVRDLGYAFLVERVTEPEEDAAAVSLPRRFFRSISLYMLPPAEQSLVEFLLLFPVAALIVCVYRNVIGLQSFGTFAPALIGLAFRDLRSWPGILVFVLLLLVGWGFRRLIDRYHLLQVPRVAVLLSVIVLVLICAIVAANWGAVPATRYLSLFPIVILTGMVERFWTLEAEDGAGSSFRTLLVTLLVTATIALVLSLPALTRHLFHYPETLGLVMAVQLLIGRYTGYRLSELFRFRDFAELAPVPE